MTVKIINRSQHPLPNYETIASAGMDLRANLDEPVVLNPLGRAIIKTGLFIEYLNAKHRDTLDALKAGKFTDELTDVLEKAAAEISAIY